MAVKAYKAIDASGLSRVDFFLKEDGSCSSTKSIRCPDSQTFPDFQKCGKRREFLLQRSSIKLIQFAIERHHERARNETSI